MLNALLPEIEFDNKNEHKDGLYELNRFDLEKLCKNVWPALVVIGGNVICK